MNTDKTRVLPLGPAWVQDNRTAGLSIVHRGENFKWCGYALFPDGDSKLFWDGVLRGIVSKLEAAQHRSLSPGGRVFYANAHVISTVLHVLSFDLPPQNFIREAEKALVKFVWGGAGVSTVAKEIVFMRRANGGLGLLSIEDIVHAVALQYWDAVAGSNDAIWAALARESWHSLGSGSTMWHLLGVGGSNRNLSATIKASTRWNKVILAARKIPPIVDSHKLSQAELFHLPPLLPCLYTEGLDRFSDIEINVLQNFNRIYEVYYRKKGQRVHVVHGIPGYYQHVHEGSRLEITWERVSGQLIAHDLLPPLAVDYRRPLPIGEVTVPKPQSFSFLGLQRPFRIRDMRRLINL